jgi:hypothetical protein
MDAPDLGRTYPHLSRSFAGTTTYVGASNVLKPTVTLRGNPSLPDSIRRVHVVVFALLSASAAFGQVAAVAQQVGKPAAASWEDSLWLPVHQFFQSLFESKPVAAPSAVPTTTAFEAEPGCPVAALDQIDDAAAQELEASTGPGVVDIADMMPAAARALSQFELKVASVGGMMILKSAYRPAAYQKHLQNVWHKWMDELKNNREPACQVLRTEVQEEFARHRLIETQHPVPVSDHTRGLAFDATVKLPAAKEAGRRLTLDGLARLAGLLRPAIASDPVHFKFLGMARPRSPVLRRRRVSA